MELEKLFATSHSDEKMLRALENELGFRQVPRAVALLADVQAVLNGTRHMTSSDPRPMTRQEPFPTRQPELWEAIPLPPPTSTPPMTIPLRPRTEASESTPTMTVEEAYKILRATASSTWESIEQIRRQLVQKAHPDNVVGMSADKRSAIQSEANRANVAYSVLRRSRIG
jgi:hypothetical protein